MKSDIFETHYEDYCRKIAELDFSSLKDIIDIDLKDDKAVITFFGEEFTVSGSGIMDSSGKKPDYGVCVVLSKYMLLCPLKPVVNEEWVSLKDFHKNSQFTNINVFSTDAEKPIIKNFSGRVDLLSDASKKLGGKPLEMGLSYDISMVFEALPKIKVLLLFNDSDDEFPASCSLLFQRQAEEYLDPESLIMVGIALTNRLKRIAV